MIKKKKNVTTAYRYVKVDIKKTNKQKRKEKRSTLKQGVLGAPGNISFGSVHARITDLSFTVVIQFYRIFLEFSHQVICCHKSEVFVT